MKSLKFNIFAAGVLGAIIGGVFFFDSPSVVFAQAEKVSPVPKLLAEFPGVKPGQPILVPVVFNGKTYPFLLDTGSERTFFDISLKPLLGEPRQKIQMAENDPSKSLLLFNPPDAKLGSLSLKRGGLVICIDLSEARRSSGLTFYGVLGMTFLRRYAVQFDVDAGKVRFFESAEGRDVKEWGPAATLYSAGRSRLIALNGKLDKFEAPFLFDSAMTGPCILGESLYDRLKEDKVIIDAGTRVRTQDEDGEHFSPVARLEKLTIGETPYANLLVQKGASNASYLGLDFIARHTLTLDVSGRKAYFKPGARFKASDEFNMTGLHVFPEKQGLTIKAIDADSPGVTASLKIGDILTRIDNKSVTDIGLGGVYDIFRSQPGRRIEVIFKRNGKLYKTFLVLKRRV